jgi:hypothetical protein
MNDPIIITGVPRSGTSLIAGIFNRCGAFIGKTCGATGWNKKGQFEHEAVRRIIKEGLTIGGFDPRGQINLPPREYTPYIDDLKIRINQIFCEEGYISGEWLFKEPKTLLIWRALHKVFPNAHWIITRRPVEGIVKSCHRVGFINKLRTSEEIRTWVGQQLEFIGDLTSCDNANTTEVWSNKIIAGDYTEIENAVTKVGLPFNKDIVKLFIDEELYHG